MSFIGETDKPGKEQRIGHRTNVLWIALSNAEQAAANLDHQVDANVPNSIGDVPLGTQISESASAANNKSPNTSVNSVNDREAQIRADLKLIYQEIEQFLEEAPQDVDIT